MKKHLILILFIFLLTSCLQSQNIPPNVNFFEPISLSQGKMTQVNGQWIIYEEGAEMEFEVNGECLFNQEAHPCMWHGFILEYNYTGNEVDVECKSSRDVSVNVGTSFDLIEENAFTDTYTIKLSGSENVFVSNQFITEDPNLDEDIDRIQSATICEVDGVRAFAFEQIFVFRPDQ